jgi:hypothetical protein
MALDHLMTYPLELAKMKQMVEHTSRRKSSGTAHDIHLDKPVVKRRTSPEEIDNICERSEEHTPLRMHLEHGPIEVLINAYFSPSG